VNDGGKVEGTDELRLSPPENVSATHSVETANGIAGFLQFSRVPGWLMGLFLVAMVIIVYQPVWHAGFIWDDDTFLVNNPLIRQADGLYQFWFTARAPDYFPLTSTTLWLEWRLWGANPLGYHIINVLLHALSAVLIWRVLARLKIPGSWLAAALFAVHPVNVESVAWITERKNTLAMLFYLTSILCYLRFEDACRWRWYGMALGSFVLALLSKTAVTPLPIVLLGMAWWRHGRISIRNVRRTLPFFGVAVLLGWITIWFQSHNAIGSEVIRTDSLWSRLAVAGWAVWFYLYKALLPLNLMFVYPKWQIDATNLLSYIPLLLVLVGAAVLWRYRRGWSRAWLFGLGYFVVMLLPVLGFLNIYFMNFSLVADHWQYFAIIGPIGLVASGITLASDRLKKRNFFLLPVIFSAILLLALSFLTWRQTCNYSDNEKLWKITIAKNPDCWLAYNNLGIILEKKGQIDKAIVQYHEVIRLKPDLAVAYFNRGSAYSKLSRYQPAIEDFNKAARLKPDYADVYNNRGVVYVKLGRDQQAIGDFNEAIRLKPDLAVAYCNRAIVYFNQGNNKYGCHDVQKACESGNCKLLELAKRRGYCH
jgi:tetratricopeptide (TPR) repeat protein